MAAARAASAVPAVAAPPAAPLDPAQAHQAKLAALQALLALGDAKADASKGTRFADTEPADDGYATTQFADRADGSSGPTPLLNLDKLKPKRSRAQR